MLPQTSVHQRQPMYEDVVNLITFGFLSAVVRVHNVNISLRTLSEGDLFLLRQRTAYSTDEDFRRWLLATSTWMVNGQVLLEDPNSSVICHRAYRLLRPSHLKILSGLAYALANKHNSTYNLVEAFCHEGASRSLWRQSGGNYPNPSYSGLPTDKLGMSVPQRIWIAHNTIEDIRERNEAEWAHAKLVASAMSPKGIEQLNQKESTARQTERERKQDLLDRTYYKWIGYLKEDGTVAGSPLPVFRQASTPDELAEEMRKWVSGEMDFHDQVVADYKQNVLEAYEREMEARRARVEEVRQELEENGEDPSAIKLVGYTLDQIQDRIQPALHKTVYENAKGAQYLRDRYLANEPSRGNLAVKGGKVVVEGVPPSQPLGEEVAGRSVKYGVKG